MCVCVERSRKERVEKEEEEALEEGGYGGGLRTKETNLNEMTCFGRVKLGELGSLSLHLVCTFIYRDQI